MSATGGVRFSDVIEAIVGLWKVDRVPALHGYPGIGKSAAGYVAAKRCNLEVVETFYLAQELPEELKGFRMPDLATKRVVSYFIDRVARLNDIEPGVVFLDEYAQAFVAVKNAMRPFIQKDPKGRRYFGDLEIKVPHKIILAGNARDMNCGVQPTPEHFKACVCDIEMGFYFDDFYTWAKHRLHPTVLAYLDQNRDFAFMWKLGARGPNPRAWEAVSDLMNAQVSGRALELACSGLIGEVGTKFYNWLDIRNELPDLPSILKTGEAAHPDRPDLKILIALMLEQHANKKNLGNIMKYLSVWNEHQRVFVDDMTTKHPSLTTHPAFGEWVAAGNLNSRR